MAREIVGGSLRIVEHEQSGSERAGYGEALLKRLAQDLTIKLGRGFSERNIRQMRQFYLGWPLPTKATTCRNGMVSG